MERKIGEIFEYNGEWLQCVEQPKKYDKTVCALCAFQGNGNCELDRCSGTYRSDKKFVIFKRLEKVGEPYEHYEKLYQCYKLPMETEIRLLPNNCYPIGKDNLVEIEIKQTKEDMEEKKLNLKPFDIQKAREGKPVCTRDGRKARIICFDAKGDPCPIIALVEENGIESAYHYDKNGQNAYNKSKLDLMMLPEKKEGWVNVYKKEQNRYVKGIFPSREIALNSISEKSREYIATIKITWEELL